MKAKVAIPHFLALVLLLARSPIAEAGNGSVGVGNRHMIAPGIETVLPKSETIRKNGNLILDGGTGEPLLRVESTSRESVRALSRRRGTQLVEARLGRLRGYEFLPWAGKEKAQENHWIVCGADGGCHRLIPLSRTNAKIQSIISGLKPQD